ncbi:zinc finger CCHC domain-containing protein 9 [Helicoverpa armigera]|uniref:zinc finger CCHC domain-containing protein 9 n=1 Tax=Helicoverpa armigera TaxID=29058 RepID=UPI003082827A
MTRFARAKGSKSSNERAPEDSTPWEVMKEQLLQAKVNNEESKKRKEAEQQRIENYENFLKDHRVQKRKATWCDFPEVENKKKTSDSTVLTESSAKPKKKNKKKVGNAEVSEASHCDSNAQPATSETNESTVKKPKKKKNKNSQSTPDPQNVEKTTDVTQNTEGGKKNKKKKNKQNKTSEESTDNPKDNNTNSAESNEIPKNNQTKAKNKKNKKLIDGKPVRRKEINDRSFQLIVHGKEIELVRFDGFPVMKKDAERLQELKTNMIKKGIPKSEVQRTMKLERRRAEKALARMKREVCYNCRKGGHVLSDCPELKSKIPGADTAEGVCFKCGSTEHRQFECKVQRDKEFRFATCFICKEPGHIARQCPDNPKGLYPNGGSCKLCGDVTHLRKDCPTVMDKKEETTVKLHTLDSSENIEDVGQQQNKFIHVESSKKPKKIKF